MAGELIDPQTWKAGLGEGDRARIDALQRYVEDQPYDLEFREWFDEGRSGSLVARVVHRQRGSRQVVLKFCSSKERVQKLHEAWDAHDPFCQAHLARTDHNTITDGSSLRAVFMEIAKGDLSLYQDLAKTRHKEEFPSLCGQIVRSVIVDWNKSRPISERRSVGRVVGDLVGGRAGDVLAWIPTTPTPDDLDPRAFLSGDVAPLFVNDVFVGKAHGDLSGRNVLLHTRHEVTAEDYQLIDYDHFAADAVLANDPMHLLVALALDDFKRVLLDQEAYIKVIMDPHGRDIPRQVREFRDVSVAIHDAGRASFSEMGFGGNWREQSLLALVGVGLVHLGRKLKVSDPQKAKQWCYELATAAADAFRNEYHGPGQGPDPPGGPDRSSIPGTDLLGREDQFRKLRARLSRGPYGMVLVRGLPGMGKTKLVDVTLAGIEVADGAEPTSVHRYLALPDRSLDLRTLIDMINGEAVPATYAGGMSSLVRLEAVLASLGRTPVIVAVDSAENLLDPENRVMVDPDLDEAFEMLSVEQGHQVSVILATQTAPISADELSWPDVDDSIVVGRVSEEKFLAYLQQMDTRGVLDLADLSPERRRLLWERLQGNPRLAELTFAVVCEAAVSDLASLVDELPAPKGDAVAAHLTRLLIHELRPLRLGVLRGLAAFGTPVPSEAVAALLSPARKTGEVKQALKVLEREHVCRKAGDELFFLPATDAAHFLQSMTKKEKRALLYRAAMVLDSRQEPHPKTVDDLRIHFAELTALIAAGQFGAAHELIRDIDEVLRTWNCSHLLLRQRLAVRGKLGRDDAERSNHNAIGGIHLTMGRLKEADEAYGAALALTRTDAKPTVEAALHNNLGLLQLAAYRTDRAQLEFTFARRAAIEAGDVEGHVGALEGLADCHRHHGQYDEATAYAVEAEDRARAETGDLPVRRLALSLKLSAWHAERAQLPAAIEWMARAEKIATTHADESFLAMFLQGQADLLLAEHLEAGLVEPAVQRAHEAVDRAIGLQNPFILQRARITLCVAHLRLGDIDQAAWQIRRANYYRRPRRPLTVFALLALVSRLTEPRRAAKRFDRLRRAADERISNDVEDFSAWDFLGFARCADAVDGRAGLAPAMEAFRMGGEDRTHPQAPGLTARMTFMLRMLDSSGTVPGSLQPVINELTRVV